MDTHHLQGAIENMVREVLVKQPDDPLAFMVEHLKKEVPSLAKPAVRCLHFFHQKRPRDDSKVKQRR